jgi:hypothetical protein
MGLARLIGMLTSAMDQMLVINDDRETCDINVGLQGAHIVPIFGADFAKRPVIECSVPDRADDMGRWSLGSWCLKEMLDIPNGVRVFAGLRGPSASPTRRTPFVIQSYAPATTPALNQRMTARLRGEMRCPRGMP